MANTLTAYDRAKLVQGQTSGGIRVPLLVAADGTLQIGTGTTPSGNITTSYDRATLIQGQTSTGVRVPILVSTDGTVAGIP